jgi:ATP-dependent helicase HrpB
MSATIDTEPLSRYVGDALVIDCPGRLYPIDIRYTPAPKTTPIWDLAANAVSSLISGGALGDILVFMPGAYEIRRTMQAIQQTVLGESVSVLPLYGDLPPDRQRQVMERQSRRKVIVATNIAETSLTIPGVRHVVDSGLARVNRYDPGRGFNTLFIEPISLDGADQRAGRAGREAAGICMRLWSMAQNAGRPRSATPEIGRVDLAETLLFTRMLGYANATDFQWFEAPGAAALQAGLELLGIIGALNDKGELTDIGRELGKFPMHPRLARLLMEAGRRGAVHLATFAAALLSERSAIMGKPEYPEEAYRVEAVSDFFGLYCILEKVRTSGYDPALCMRHGVNASAAKAIFRTQALFLHYCRRLGMHTRDSQDAPGMLARCMLAAYPDRLCARKDHGTLLCSIRGGRSAELARESIARGARLFIAADVREIKTASSDRKAILSLASEIKEEWLREDAAGQWTEEFVVEWNPRSQSVEGHTRTMCCGVLIAEKTGKPQEGHQASALLAETIGSKGLALMLWDDAVDQWINRVRWTAGLFPEKQLPLISEEERRLVLYELCDGEVSYERVKAKPVLPVFKQLLGEQLRGFVDAMAPEAIVLPSGRKMRIIYEPGKPPRGRARIQDLFGMTATPRIAEGTVSLSIEVLAPNNRPVQITDDLKSFWNSHYPNLKKTLSRKYPKHEWR